MLSELSKTNLGYALQRAARKSLVRDATDACRIESLETGTAMKHGGAALVLVTISSFDFRLLTVFQLSADTATRAYYMRGTSSETLEESFHEFANVCCGALNRELSVQYPQSAMSIPNQLGSPCLAFLDYLGPQCRSTYDVTINESVQMRIHLCMRSSVDINIPSLVASAIEVGGELELF